MRVALTGAASGIGAATAARLKSDGAEIVAFDIAEPSANVDRWIPTDMSDPASIIRAASSADGTFDALLNIAGLPPREGLTKQILAVNYFGLVQFNDAMIAKLSKGGAIVNLASRAGAQWRTNIDQVKALMALDGSNADSVGGFIEAEKIDATRAYNLTKEAVIVWTMTWTEQLIGMDLRMNSVSPVAVSTGILDDFKAAFGANVAKAIARAGRAGTPEEVAELVAFLASPQSHWLKGVDIVVDGGKSAMATCDMLQLGA